MIPSRAGETGTWLAELALPVPLPQTFTYRVPASWLEDGPPAPGDLVKAPFARRRDVVGLVLSVRRVEGAVTTVGGHRLRTLTDRLPAAYRIEADRRALLDWMAAYYALPPGELVPLFHPPAPGTRGRASRTETPLFPLDDPVDIVLTPVQAAAVADAVAHLEKREWGAVLIHGVTGSGKTEVYLRVVAEALARGRGAIFLLPEIALTPQTEARIAARFGDAVATVHSGLSAGARSRVHEAAASGEVKVVVGPRSALFAPIRDLGCIIVDEEHETSYKQEEKPRYHARHAALVRARAAGACVLLGSATPDLESTANAAAGRYSLHVMNDRPIGRLPVVELVDMRGQSAPDGLSDTLTDRLERTLAAGRQAILYYNRRGFARVLQCGACGEAVQCPHCDIALTVHLRPKRLLCHYCGHAAPSPTACPDCGAEEFLPSGGGTEKLELSLQSLFPETPLLRLDQDTTRRRGSHARILSAFAAGEAGILVGTQMVAKGHHFPGVELVGVLAADDGITLPDFRAQERAFQLLSQVAGRAGRTGAGTVVFQTWQPEHPLIQAAAAHDYAAFADVELAARELSGYPPARRLLRVLITGKRLGAVESAAAALADVVRQGLSRGDLDVLGPAPAVFTRLQDRYRWLLLLKGTLNVGEKAWLADCARRLGTEHGVDLMLDVDPVGLC